MSDTEIRFEDGAAYDRMMGVWSRLVGDAFLDWLAPSSGLRWIDIGCGNGAFTEQIVARCAPAEVLGVDPSEGQLAYARANHHAGLARFKQGDARQLPAADATVDAAVMALVLFFVPDPGQGVAEMIRVVRPGGSVSAYVWDLLEPDGFPAAPVSEELRPFGIPPILPPSAEVSRMDVLEQLWRDAGLTDIATRRITVTRTFDSFEDYWATVEIGMAMTQLTGRLTAEQVALLKERLRARLPADAAGRVSFPSRANAIKGVVPDVHA